MRLAEDAVRRLLDADAVGMAELERALQRAEAAGVTVQLSDTVNKAQQRLRQVSLACSIAAWLCPPNGVRCI